ncbi:MAG: glycerol kinase [Chloroflexi bacterium HGW-Chloroflexi-5]|jgi:glycerol kinase|nr:MAG: glycerol kinase [Chloroflexi bacterium HGW-Chloroflexi-5]
MNKFVGAIDQGTTSTRFIVFDHQGNIVAVDQKEHKQYYPAPGLVEHDAIEIWNNTREVMLNAMRISGLVSEDIVALGITNQRETTVLWNKQTGQPYGHAIVWQDTRTNEICNKYALEGGIDRFRDKTGLPLSVYFSGPKIKWILDNNPEAKQDADKGLVLFGNMDSWLIWNLTGGIQGGIHVTDVSNASRTMLMNIKTLKWDKDMLAVMGIPANILPKIASSSEIYGYTQNTLERVPIAGDLGDQQAALFGQGCFRTGEAKNTYGTGCFMLMNTGETPVISKNGLLTTAGYKIGSAPAVYCLEGSIAIAGALVQWLRDNFQIIDKSSDIEPLARTVADNGDVFIVPAFSGLFAPYWRSDARGVITGLTRFVNKGHLARAALESTAFQTHEVLDAMEIDSGVKLLTLKVDGGMVTNDLLMQFQADILDVPVVRPRITETTALGAAYAAGLAVGFWQNTDELLDNWQKDKEWVPNMSEETRSVQYAKWKKAVSRTFDWIE